MSRNKWKVSPDIYNRNRVGAGPFVEQPTNKLLLDVILDDGEPKTTKMLTVRKCNENRQLQQVVTKNRTENAELEERLRNQTKNCSGFF